MSVFSYLSPSYRDLQRAKRVRQVIECAHKVDGVYTTPDAPVIDQQPIHLVFVCDQMMTGRALHRTIEQFNPQPVGRAFTDVNVRAYVNKVTGQVAVFDTNGDTLPEWQEPSQRLASPIPIRGEVFAVGKSAVFALDRIMRNNIEFERTLISTTGWVHKTYYSHLYSRHHTTVERPKTNPAWIYYARPDRLAVSADTWAPLPWHKSRRNYKPTYYSFCEDPNNPNRRK